MHRPPSEEANWLFTGHRIDSDMSRGTCWPRRHRSSAVPAAKYPGFLYQCLSAGHSRFGRAPLNRTQSFSSSTSSSAGSFTYIVRDKNPCCNNTTPPFSGLRIRQQAPFHRYRPLLDHLPKEISALPSPRPTNRFDSSHRPRCLEDVRSRSPKFPFQTTSWETASTRSFHAYIALVKGLTARV